jgi:transposase
VRCPVCSVPAEHIHSRYTRTLADLPWAAYRVRLQLRVRKWFCPNPACVRRIFTERLPTVAGPWARRTLRLVQRLVALGLAPDRCTHFFVLWHFWYPGTAKDQKRQQVTEGIRHASPLR